MQTIYVVEDDDSIREMIIYALHSSNFKTLGFSDGGEALSYLSKEIPSLVLLDIMLPTLDGISILKKIRSTPTLENLPVIMLTAKGSELDRIKGLDYGADDYISKPFSVMEVISRVKAVLRRSEPSLSTDSKLSIGDITLHSLHRIVTVHDTEISLTYKEFELLQYMMKNADVALSRDVLLSTVWGYEYVGESRTVDMHIKSLRQKLGKAGQQIKTVRNIGYKLGEST